MKAKQCLIAAMFTLLSITTSGYAQTITNHTNTIPIQALLNCSNGLKNMELIPLKNGEVNNAIDGSILPTDSQGFFYLDQSYSAPVVQLYLAENGVIILDCAGRITPISAGKAVLGMNGHPCRCPK